MPSGGDLSVPFWPRICSPFLIGPSCPSPDAGRDLGRRLAEHKTMFFRERGGQGDVLDDDAAVLGGLHWAPGGAAKTLLATAHAGMVNDGLLFEQPPAFAGLVARCRAFQDNTPAMEGGDRASASSAPGPGSRSSGRA
jgi:hypothetical protein